MEYLLRVEMSRKIHKKEHYDLYRSPNNVRVIKSRMRWVGHVAHMGGWDRRVHGFGGETCGKEITWETQA
jgi:hypothetical protein